MLISPTIRIEIICIQFAFQYKTILLLIKNKASFRMACAWCVSALMIYFCFRRTQQNGCSTHLKMGRTRIILIQMARQSDRVKPLLATCIQKAKMLKMPLTLTEFFCADLWCWSLVDDDLLPRLSNDAPQYPPPRHCRLLWEPIVIQTKQLTQRTRNNKGQISKSIV